MISKYWLSFIVVLVFLTQVILADDVTKGGKPLVSKWGGSGGGQNAHESWRYQTFTTVSGYAARPDNEVLNEVTVEWLPIERDPLGNRCKVSGHLQFSDTGVTKNIDWFQGVAVYLAKQPNQELDWLKGIELNQASYETGFTDDLSGRFEVWFDLREMQSDRHAEQAFQFGLAFGRHEETELPSPTLCLPCALLTQNCTQVASDTGLTPNTPHPTVYFPRTRNHKPCGHDVLISR